MKKSIALTLAALMLLSFAAGCGTSDTPSQTGTASGEEDLETVIIGVFQPASGDNGAGGKQETLGIEYANFETPTVEIGGTTYKVELSIVDNQSSPTVAISAAQSLVSEGVALVLGSYGSAVSIAASDVFGDAGIAAVGVTCTNPAVTLGNDHYFRICFLDPFQGTVLANFARDQFAAEKVYVLAKLGDDYSVGLANYFMEAFGAENCVYETFPDGTSDYSSYVANAKANGADVFFSPVSTEAAALIIDQAQTQDLGVPILAGDTWDSNVILNAVMGTDVKVFVTTFYQEGGDEAFDNGLKDWLASDAEAMTNNGGDDKIAAVTAMGYDAYYLALEALKAAGSIDPADVLEVLPDVTYTGVSGPIAFDENGDAIRNTAFVKVTENETGEWVFVAQQGIE